jgi:hypothetical protein
MPEDAPVINAHERPARALLSDAEAEEADEDRFLVTM